MDLRISRLGDAHACVLLRVLSRQVKGLLNALERYPWDARAGGKARVHISLLPLLCAYAQRRLPYRVEGVDANDVLYGGNRRYVAELRQYFATLVEGTSFIAKRVAYVDPLHALCVGRLTLGT